MTNEQKEKIYELRLQGIGYRAIAKTLDVRLDSVKSYCKRHHLNGSNELVQLNAKVIKEKNDFCKHCNNPLSKKKCGRTRKFCSEECRRKWWREYEEFRRKNEAAIYHYSCSNCGKNFQAYGNSKRKYCSHSCYTAHRFGKTDLTIM